MAVLHKNFSLKPFNTFGLDVLAKEFLAFSSLEDLKEGLSNVESGRSQLILGGGSNILFTKNFDGLVLKNELKGVEVIHNTSDHIFVKVMAGENWHQFVLYAISQDWAGIENLSLIPGTVGAAPMQNIGAYGVEIESVFERLEALNMATLEIEEFDKERCHFGYRESIFKKEAKGKYVITSVTLRLNKAPQFNVSYGAIKETLEAMNIDDLSIKSISNAVIQIRQSKLPDPKIIGNAGSFFKNPTIEKIDYEGLKAEFSSIPGYQQDNNRIKVPAAWLIEQAGWKGQTFDEIGVHTHQPLVLVNHGNGDGSKIKNLALKIQDSVASKFGIELATEVNII